MPLYEAQIGHYKKKILAPTVEDAMREFYDHIISINKQFDENESIRFTALDDSAIKGFEKEVKELNKIAKKIDPKNNIKLEK